MYDHKWIVHPYSYKERGSREVSVIHTTEFHGLESYGWFCDRKIFIANDSIYGLLNDDVAKQAIIIAENMAAELNNNSPVPEHEVIEIVDAYKKQQENFSKMASDICSGAVRKLRIDVGNFTITKEK